MPKAVNGMKICSRKDCPHGGQPQPISNFNKCKTRSDGLDCVCKDCVKIYKDKTRDHNREVEKEYRENNKEKRKETFRNFYYRDIEANRARVREYYQNNSESRKEYSKKYRESPAKPSRISSIEKYEECRINPENENEMQVRCFNSNCRKWFTPTNMQVTDRLSCINGSGEGELHLYCCEECKQTCSVYKTKKDPAEKKEKTSSCERKNNMQSELREMVLQLDNYTCQMCGNSLEEFPDLNLVCHHIKPMATDLMLASDVDNCITLCEECHGKVHTLPGCSLVELQKKAREQRESLKEIINKN